MADGFIFGGANRFMQKLARLLREELEAQGRAKDPFGIETIVGYGHGPDSWRQDLEAWRALGVTHFSMRAMSTGVALSGEADPGFTKPQQHIDALGRFIKEVS